MRVAAVQFNPKHKDRESNLQVAARLVFRAAQDGAQLVVLPELCTTGYSFLNPVEAEPYAEVISDYGNSSTPPLSMMVFGALSQKLRVSIAWGVMEKDSDGKLYNSQVLMTPSGQWISYRKINRWANDWLWAEAGESNPPVLVVGDKKVGLLICRDIRDKADQNWDDFYEKGDADIICFSANWGDGGFPATPWMDFAKDTETCIVVGNRYGKEDNNNFGEGGIGVIYPNQTVVCDGLKWNEDCIVHAKV